MIEPIEIEWGLQQLQILGYIGVQGSGIDRKVYITDTGHEKAQEILDRLTICDSLLLILHCGILAKEMELSEYEGGRDEACHQFLMSRVRKIHDCRDTPAHN